MSKNTQQSKEKQASSPKVVAAKPFAQQSRFGGTGNASFTQKSQYKPTPVRITQHKG